MAPPAAPPGPDRRPGGLRFPVSPRARAWAAAGLWLGLIYLSLPVGLPVLLFFLRRGVLVPLLLGACLAALAIILARIRRLPPGYPRLRLEVAAALGALSLAAFPAMETVGEWVHLPQYLVLGLLLHGALRHDWAGVPLVLVGAGIVALAGWGDELIQSALPRRFFAWRDVFLNLLGGVSPIAALAWRERNRPGGRRGAALLAAGLILLAAPGAARAWTETGHRVVARIAEERLSPRARRGVRRLLRPGEDLPAVSAWADRYAQTPEGRATACWHTVFFPAGARRYAEGRDCPGGCCIVQAIEAQRAVLSDPGRPPAERRRALMFVVHLVADIHQPLHAGHRADGGGGAIPLRFRGRRTTLHHLWDQGLLEAAGLGEAALAAWARRAVPSSLPQGGPAAWAEESHRLALSHAYAVRPGEEVREGYLRWNLAVVLRRLGEAGLRLARLLEAALGGGPQKP